jgi:hypothetical protein
MKATIDIPDALYRQVKAKTALRGLTVREVAATLFQTWVAADQQAPEECTVQGKEAPAPAWFGAARSYAQRVSHHDLAAVRASIARGRAREDAAGSGGG